MKVFKIDDGEEFFMIAENESVAKFKFWDWHPDSEGYPSQQEMFNRRGIDIQEMDGDETLKIRMKPDVEPRERFIDEILDDKEALRSNYGIFAASVW